MNKFRAFDTKSLFAPILFPWFKLSLMMSQIWNKRVGSSFYYIGLVGMIEVYMEEYIVVLLLLRSLGYRLSLSLGSLPPSIYRYFWWKWIEECIEDWGNTTWFLDMIRNRTWFLDLFCILEYVDVCLVHIDVCGCEDSSSGNLCSETVMIYDKRSRILYWWRGFSFFWSTVAGAGAG